MVGFIEEGFEGGGERVIWLFRGRVFLEVLVNILGRRVFGIVVE